MAKAQQQPEPAPVLDTPEELGPPKSYRLQVTLGLVALILLQMTVLWCVLPAKPVVQERIGLPLGAPDNLFDAQPLVPPDPGRPEILAERPIGPLRVRSEVNERNETFALTMNVTVRQREVRRFETEYERREQRVVDAVETVLRLSSPDERREAEYTTIRARAKQAINEVLGTPWVQEVLVRDVTLEAN